ERRVRRVEVVAVGPHAAGLDAAAHAVGRVAVARPNAGAEAVERVVGHGERFGLGLELRHRQNRAEDLLLEDAHLVVTLEYGRLDVVAVLEAGADLRALAPGQ